MERNPFAREQDDDDPAGATDSSFSPQDANSPANADARPALVNPYGQSTVQIPRRSFGAPLENPFTSDTSPLKLTQARITASANKTKSNFMRLLDKADSQLTKLVLQNKAPGAHVDAVSTPTPSLSQALFAAQRLPPSLTKHVGASANSSGKLSGAQSQSSSHASQVPSEDKQQLNLQKNQLRSLLGSRMDDNPGERDVLLCCPRCALEVFDTGLLNQVTCSRCRFQFGSEQKRPVEKRSENSNQVADEEAKGVERNLNAPHRRSKTLHSAELNEAVFFDNDDEDDQDAGGSNARQPIEENADISAFSIEWQPQEKKSERPMASYSEQEDFFASEDSTQLISHIDQRLNQLPSPFSAGATRGKQKSTATAHQLQSSSALHDSSSKYVNELEGVLLFVSQETVLSDFKSDDGHHVDFGMLLEKLLMPFFQLRVRILERQSYFQIGDTQFYIAACAPFDFGKVTAQTSIKLTHEINRSEPLQHVVLVPLKRLNSNRDEMLSLTLQPFFQKNIGRCLHRNQIIEVDEEHEFYIRYARPFFGQISQGTNVNIDSNIPKYVRLIRVAPIWATQAEYEHCTRHKGSVLRYLHNQVLAPYLKSGLLQVYLEKGETIQIFSQKFFINDSHPRQGIVDNATQIELEIGFTQETFDKKQVLADQRMAERLMMQQTDNQIGSSHQTLFHRTLPTVSHHHEFLRAVYQHQAPAEAVGLGSADDEQAAQELMDQLLMQPLPGPFGALNSEEMMHNSSSSVRRAARKSTPKAIVSSLPKRRITVVEIEKNRERRLSHAQDEGLSACLVCLTEYEDNEEIRTMPCLHFFHRRCIDKWLLECGSKCPICKFDVRRDYNITSPEQSAAAQRHSVGSSPITNPLFGDSLFDFV